MPLLLLIAGVAALAYYLYSKGALASPSPTTSTGAPASPVTMKAVALLPLKSQAMGDLTQITAGSDVQKEEEVTLGTAFALQAPSSAVTLASMVIAGKGANLATVVSAFNFVQAIELAVEEVVLFFVAAFDDAQWVSDALRKGQAGLITDMSVFSCGVATKCFPGMDTGVTYWLALAIAQGYNDLALRCVDQIQWGIGATAVSNRAYWAARAMYVVDEGALATDIATRLNATPAQIQKASAAGMSQTVAIGQAAGRMLWCWGFDRQGMLEPWHHDWFSKSIFNNGGFLFSGINTVFADAQQPMGVGANVAVAAYFAINTSAAGASVLQAQLRNSMLPTAKPGDQIFRTQNSEIVTYKAAPGSPFYSTMSSFSGIFMYDAGNSSSTKLDCEEVVQ